MAKGREASKVDRVLRGLVRERFVVTLTVGPTFAGLLTECDERTLVLADAEQLSTNGARVRVDGFLYLDRAQIAYVQRPMTLREVAP